MDDKSSDRTHNAELMELVVKSNNHECYFLALRDSTDIIRSFVALYCGS